MSEDTTATAAPAPAPAPAEGEPALVPTEPVEAVTDSEPEVAKEPDTPAEPAKVDVPKKFLKSDGTPDLEKLSKAYTNLEKKLGSKPNVPASSVDEYVYDFGDFEVNEENSNAFKAAALEKGFTKEQYSWLMESHSNVIKNMIWSADKAEAALKEAWGAEYATNAQAAKAGFDEFAPSDADPHDPVWNNPAVMKLLARMGSELGEDSIKPHSNGGTSGTSVQEQITALRNDPDYWSPAKQKQMYALYERLPK